MSKLHVAKTYKAEWHNTDAFNHRPYELRILLNELNIPVSSMSSSDDDDFLDFEVLRKDWVKAIVRLESTKANVDSGLITEKCDAILAVLQELNCSLDKVIEIFKSCLEVAEPNDDWMHFSFF